MWRREGYVVTGKGKIGGGGKDGRESGREAGALWSSHQMAGF
jgi:hypothetical protein